MEISKNGLLVCLWLYRTPSIFHIKDDGFVFDGVHGDVFKPHVFNDSSPTLHRFNANAFTGIVEITVVCVYLIHPCGHLTADHYAPMPFTRLAMANDDAFTWDSHPPTILVQA